MSPGGPSSGLGQRLERSFVSEAGMSTCRRPHHNKQDASSVGTHIVRPATIDWMPLSPVLWLQGPNQCTMSALSSGGCPSPMSPALISSQQLAESSSCAQSQRNRQASRDVRKGVCSELCSWEFLTNTLTIAHNAFSCGAISLFPIHSINHPFP